MAITVKSMGGGGTSSSDVTASSAQVLAGYTAVTTDSNDEPKQGTIATKTAEDMTVSANTVTAPAGYYATNTSKSVPVSTLDNSIISGTAYEEETGDYAWRSTVQVPAGYHEAQTLEKTFSEIFPAPQTEGTADKMRLGYQLYNHEGKVITGTMTESSAATYTASTSDQTIPGDQYLMGPQTIKAVSLNVTASNMLSGTTASIESNGTTVTSVAGTIPTYNGEYTEIRDWLCFTANTAESTISIQTLGVPTLGQNFQTSIDRLTWTEFIPDTTTITLTNTGDKVYFKGNNPMGVSEDTSIYYQFVITGNITASGNIMSLVDNGACACTTIPNSYCFFSLFYGCSSLTTPPKLPATTLTPSCYQSMFSGCSLLTSAPKLPANTLANYCYLSMFYECTALTAAPTLPATTLAIQCYGDMFYGCTSLTTVPSILPATTLARSCYSFMFSFCSRLTAAPALPATTLAENCYTEMFEGCTSLVASPALPATALASQCYSSMFMGCSSLVKVPVLPATALTNMCYMGMFAYCASLIVSDTSGTGYAYTWRIPSTGTFVESIEQPGMFAECAGTRSSEDMMGEAGQSYTYYTQNPPIG